MLLTGSVLYLAHLSLYYVECMNERMNGSDTVNTLYLKNFGTVNMADTHSPPLKLLK